MHRKLSQTLLVLGSMTLIALFRRPDAFFQPQFFVEDGAIFFKDDYERGAAAIFRSYAGYLHVIPRLIAFAASAFPLEQRPRVYVYACLLILWLIAMLTMRERVNLPNKPIFAIAPMLIPIGPFMFLHLTNIQWFTAIVLLLLFLQRPAESWKEGMFDACLCLPVGLTGPFSLIAVALLPLRIWTFGYRRTELPVLVTLLVTASIQTALLFKTPSQRAGSFHHITADFLSLQGARYLLGDIVVRLISQPHLRWISLTLVAGLLLTIVIAKNVRKQALLFLIAMTALFLVGAYRSYSEAPQVNAFQSGIRYMFLPHLCATFVLLLGMTGDRFSRAVAAPLLLLAGLASASSFTMPMPENLHFERYCDDIRAGKQVTVPLLHKGWSMTLNRKSAKQSSAQDTKP